MAEATTSQNPVVLWAQELSYHYTQGTETIPVLRKVDLKVTAGKTIALLGPSGSGKSTLLHLLGLLDVPKGGTLGLLYAGQWADVATLSDTQRTHVRGSLMGFVYQFHHLLPEFTALENVMLPLLIMNTPYKAAQEHARHVLHQVDMHHRSHHLPSELSGGQQQRVAIARALANKPKILLADEPTGNLDEKNAQDVLHLFQHLCGVEGVSLVMATHNTSLCPAFHEVFYIQEGQLHPAAPGLTTETPGAKGL